MSGQVCAKWQMSLSAEDPPAERQKSLSTEDPPAKRRAESKRTAEKWVVENDRVLNTSVWLKFDVADRDHVLCLKRACCLLPIQGEATLHAQLSSRLH